MQKRVSVQRLQTRRETLTAAHPDVTMIIHTGHRQQRNGRRDHRFRADSNALYLAGVHEPGATLALPAGGEPVLFLSERSPSKTHWEGALPDWSEIATWSGIADIRPAHELPGALPDLIGNASDVAWSRGQHHTLDHLLIEQTGTPRRGRFLPGLLDLRGMLAPLRMKKDAEEIALMREVGAATARAHLALMKQARVGDTGVMLAARFQAALAAAGIRECAFDGIFALGEQGTCLHPAPDATRVLGEGDLVLVDAGGEHPGGYASDQTRVFPVSGRFTDAQRELHDLVHEAYRAALDVVRVGASLGQIDDAARDVLARGVQRLGWEGEVDAWFTHRTSHGIGLDVHEWLPVEHALEVGHVFTIEPGLYIDAEDTRVPERYRGVGVRIEDTIAISHDDGAPDVLTAGAPRDAEGIEALFG